MSNIAIRIEGLGKRYRIGKLVRYKTLRDGLADLPGRARRAVASRWTRQRDETTNGASDSHIWALKDMSFEVKRGEVIGIIGRNGAGKSTLLKILSRITEPTTGYADIYGRVGSLLEVGTGFHPELTGRENIHLNGAVLGMKKSEITKKFDEIVAFAETERFLDTPVKHYSSGMYLRLAFAVAAHLEPDILLVDEVLAVGDVAFQKKCLGKMGIVVKEGRTVLFVSHNMAAIENLCHLVHFIDQGRLVTSGTPREVINTYLSTAASLMIQSLSQRSDREGTGKLRFIDIAMHGSDGAPVEFLQCGQDAEISIGYCSGEGSLRNVSMAIVIFALSGQCLCVLNNQMVGEEFSLIPSEGRFSCCIERFPFAPGQYYMNLYCEVNGVVADWVQHAAVLTVEAGNFFGTGRLPPRSHGGMLIPQRWTVKTGDEVQVS